MDSPYAVWEDEQVRRLQQTGALRDVVGSQSKLSQELPLSQTSLDLTQCANFGSLLDAVSIVESLPDTASTVTPKERPKRAAALKKKYETPTPVKKRLKHKKPQPETLTMAQQAAKLANDVIDDPGLAKRLLLSMTLQQRTYRGRRSPPPPHVVEASFQWAHYPPLEDVLKDYMADYYHLSMEYCQSSAQTEFNNDLCAEIRTKSVEWGWDLTGFSEKQLRDRVRCYYKTHIQNSKWTLRLNCWCMNLSSFLTTIVSHLLTRQEALTNHAQQPHQELERASFDRTHGHDHQGVGQGGQAQGQGGCQGGGQEKVKCCCICMHACFLLIIISI